MVTRRHYETIAALFAHMEKEATTPEAARMRNVLARLLAVEFAADNPRFSRSRFLAACKVTP